MDDVNWRSIPLDCVNWRLTDRTGHVSGGLFNHSSPPRDPAWSNTHQWAGLTLGDLADMGEQQWLRATGVGAVAVYVIKEIIDRAAAGENVTKAGAGSHSYVPQPWPRK